MNSFQGFPGTVSPASRRRVKFFREDGRVVPEVASAGTSICADVDVCVPHEVHDDLEAAGAGALSCAASGEVIAGDGQVESQDMGRVPSSSWKWKVR